MLEQRRQETRGIVPNQAGPRVRFVDYEVQKVNLTEQKYAQELRRMGHEVYIESIRADIAGVGVAIASNDFYRAEIDLETSELQVDEALVRRDIAGVRLEYVENELKFLDNRAELMLEKWDEELRSLSIEIDVRCFDNNNRETIAEALGTPLTQGKFSGSKVKGLLSRVFGGDK